MNVPPMLIESAVYQFCGHVVTHEDGPIWKRKVKKMRELKQRETKNEGRGIRGMFWFDERAAQNGHMPIFT